MDLGYGGAGGRQRWKDRRRGGLVRHLQRPAHRAFDLKRAAITGTGWQTADEYLFPAKVRQKLQEAQRAAERHSTCRERGSLKAAQPKDLDASEIEVRLGATWIDKEYIRQFMYETF